MQASSVFARACSSSRPPWWRPCQSGFGTDRNSALLTGLIASGRRMTTSTYLPTSCRLHSGARNHGLAFLFVSVPSELPYIMIPNWPLPLEQKKKRDRSFRRRYASPAQEEAVAALVKARHTDFQRLPSFVAVRKPTI